MYSVFEWQATSQKKPSLRFWCSTLPAEEKSLRSHRTGKTILSLQSVGGALLLCFCLDLKEDLSCGHETADVSVSKRLLGTVFLCIVLIYVIYEFLVGYVISFERFSTSNCDWARWLSYLRWWEVSKSSWGSTWPPRNHPVCLRCLDA